MKRILCSLLLITLIALNSCKKEEFTNKDYIIASRNGKNWVAEPHTYFEASMQQLTITGRSETNTPMEDIRILFFPRVSDTQELKDWDAAAYITTGGDIILHEYVIDETKKSTVRVTAFDVENKRVRGVFTVHLKSRNKNDRYPNTVSYVNGKFETGY